MVPCLLGSHIFRADILLNRKERRAKSQRLLVHFISGLLAAVFCKQILLNSVFLPQKQNSLKSVMPAIITKIKTIYINHEIRRQSQTSVKLLIQARVVCLCRLTYDITHNALQPRNSELAYYLLL